MNKKWLLLIGLVALSNTVILAGAAYNRMSPPVQQLSLTERELSLPYWATRGDSENSQLTLRINWQVTQDEVEEYNYARDLKVSSQTFSALQLKPVNCPDQERRHHKSVQGWVALEYNGPAYRQRQNQLEQALAKFKETESQQEVESRSRYRNRLERALISDSRLYAVAVAPDLEELEASLGSSTEVHWFVPAELSASGKCSDRHVNILRLLNGELHLPANQRHALPELDPQSAYSEQPVPPRYAVEVAVGRRYEPWVMSVTACPESGCLQKVPMNQ